DVFAEQSIPTNMQVAIAILVDAPAIVRTVPGKAALAPDDDGGRRLDGASRAGDGATICRCHVVAEHGVLDEQVPTRHLYSSTRDSRRSEVSGNHAVDESQLGIAYSNCATGISQHTHRLEDQLAAIANHDRASTLNRRLRGSQVRLLP